MGKEVDVTTLKKRTVFIATPMYDGLCTQGYTQSLVALQRVFHAFGVKYELHCLGNESLIQRARNYMADEFMRSGNSHMLFIDADIEFDPMNVMDMLAMADPQSDRDILCGPYPKKSITFEKLVDAVKKGFIEKPEDLEDFIGDFVFNIPRGEVDVKPMEPFEISEGGTGFMMIQRHAFERFADAYPELLYRPDHKREKDFDGTREIMEYFPVEHDRGTFSALLVRAIKDIAEDKPGALDRAREITQKFETASHRLLSEDYQFCRMARDIGLKVWLLPWLRLAHHGRYAFRGNLLRMLFAHMSPTYHKAVGVKEYAEPGVSVPF